MIDKNKIENVINDYKNGLPVLDIAKKYNVSSCTIYKKLQDKNISKRIKNRFSPKHREKIIFNLYYATKTGNKNNINKALNDFELSFLVQKHAK